MGKYYDKRQKYFNLVIKKYSEGMTAKEIEKIVPVSDSTIYRWVEEHLGKESKRTADGEVIPRTPASVAKTIRSMRARITELECRLEMETNKNKVLRQIVELLKSHGELQIWQQ